MFGVTELSEEPLMVLLPSKSALLRLTSVSDAIPQRVSQSSRKEYLADDDEMDDLYVAIGQPVTWGNARDAYLGPENHDMATATVRTLRNHMLVQQRLTVGASLTVSYMRR
ncbi:hypothetical protein PMZ80_010987 [Knufia obscura]|uniref:Uncharacterized protein n=1 Tax=Knufia obscura TaxID=1635080 RepID=A0ABR0R952_9EURO|nr:hypothetical protein PMZ80_010987 [Knufia obscura]